jgi:hypothetical protein
MDMVVNSGLSKNKSSRSADVSFNCSEIMYTEPSYRTVTDDISSLQSTFRILDPEASILGFSG